MKLEMAARKELRQFGVLAGSLIAVVLGGLVPWLRASACPAWPWIVGAGLAACGLIYPAGLRHPFAVWTAAGRLLGWINSRIALAAVFYLVVTPMGLLMRLMGRDPMMRKFEPEAQTYRVANRRTAIDNFERPF